MTKQEVLQDIDKLCDDIDMWVGDKIMDDKFQNIGRLCWESEKLVVSARQELSFIRDYIEENVKED